MAIYPKMRVSLLIGLFAFSWVNVLCDGSLHASKTAFDALVVSFYPIKCPIPRVYPLFMLCRLTRFCGFEGPQGPVTLDAAHCMLNVQLNWYVSLTVSMNEYPTL